MEERAERRGLLVSRGWVQAAIVVVLFGFLVLGLLAYLSYTDDPPVPARVVDERGQTLFTGDDVRAGQKVFLQDGLMEYGSIFGHGAYLGPDYTADYLHRAALSVERTYGGAGSDTARARTASDFQANRYDAATNTLTYTAAQAEAFSQLERYYGNYFGKPTTQFGLKPNAITDPTQIHELTAFFSWSAWSASARRPGTTTPTPTTGRRSSS